MGFGKLSETSVKFDKGWKGSENFGCIRVYSVSGRHDDDRKGNAPDVFQKASAVFIISDLYRVIPQFSAGIRTSHEGF